MPDLRGHALPPRLAFRAPDDDRPRAGRERADRAVLASRAAPRAPTRRASCLAFEDEDGDVEAIPVPEGWTRIGRSFNADIRLDDPTVSRRHALVVKTESGELRVLDDRSLNGLFVNGDQVEWSHLRDGDELAIGRYRLHLVDTRGDDGGRSTPRYSRPEPLAAAD